MQDVTLFFFHHMILFFFSQSSSLFPKLILVKTDHPSSTNCWSSRGIQGHWPSSCICFSPFVTISKNSIIVRRKILNCCSLNFNICFETVIWKILILQMILCCLELQSELKWWIKWFYSIVADCILHYNSYSLKGLNGIGKQGEL